MFQLYSIVGTAFVQFSSNPEQADIYLTSNQKNMKFSLASNLGNPDLTGSIRKICKSGPRILKEQKVARMQ